MKRDREGGDLEEQEEQEDGDVEMEDSKGKHDEKGKRGGKWTSEVGGRKGVSGDRAVVGITTIIYTWRYPIYYTIYNSYIH